MEPELAYVISRCDPSSLFCNCGWGAYIITLVAALAVFGNIALFFARIKFQIFTIISLALLALIFTVGLVFESVGMNNVRAALLFAEANQREALLMAGTREAHMCFELGLYLGFGVLLLTIVLMVLLARREKAAKN